MNEAPIKLSNLIEKLRICPRDALVYMSNGYKVSNLISWRGKYAELSLDSFDSEGETISVATLLTDCEAAIGKTFEGYKGGDFVMGGDTNVWADQYSEYARIAITDVTVHHGGKVVVHLVKIND